MEDDDQTSIDNSSLSKIENLKETAAAASSAGSAAAIGSIAAALVASTALPFIGILLPVMGVVASGYFLHKQLKAENTANELERNAEPKTTATTHIEKDSSHGPNN